MSGEDNNQSRKSERRGGAPRRWADQWVYKNFEKNQDRLFEITKDLTDKVISTEQNIGGVRKELSEVERRVNKRFNWLYTLLIASLVALVFNLVKEQIGFGNDPVGDMIEKMRPITSEGGTDAKKPMEVDKAFPRE